jgi:4'-phosphopantetheinyl transferase
MSLELWTALVDDVADRLPALEALLSPEERKRAKTFKVDPPRRIFIAGRGLLRILLGALTDAAPETLVFGVGPHGKPFLPGGPAFNLAHSGRTLLFAACAEGEVGVDVERIREIDAARLASRYFSANESSALVALPETHRLRGFFACWTRKEAYLKAVGTGIADGLEVFDVTVDPEGPARMIAHRRDPAETGRWRLTDVDLGPDHAAAVCIAADLPASEGRRIPEAPALRPIPLREVR